MPDLTKPYLLTREDGVELAVLLSDEDVKRYGDAVRPAPAAKAVTPSNKSATAQNK